VCKVDANKLLTHAEIAKHLVLASSSLSKIMLARDEILEVSGKQVWKSVQEKKELEDWGK
jgi:hypothetical protein